MTNLLKKLNLEAKIAYKGQEAVNFAKSQSYDLILMDVQMLEMDGLQATLILRESLPKAKQPIIVALTANALAEDRERCFAAGMNDHLNKPVTEKRLQSLLVQWFPQNKEFQDTAPLFNQEQIQSPAQNEES